MFPSKADIKCFTSEEVKRIQELWEPKYGDWVYLPRSEQVRVVTGLDRMGEVRLVEVRTHWLETRDLIFLPRQGQLQEMLEERGYGLYHLGDERLQPDFEGRDWNPEEPYIAFAVREPSDHVEGIGPTPAIALARALIEVIKEE